MTDTLLCFDHVSAFHGKKETLKDISFSLRRGDITALIGRNGSGKTTLLRTALGIQPSKGQISLCDAPLASLSPRARAKSISLMPQFLPTSDLPLFEFVMLGRLSHGSIFSRPSEEDRAFTHRALESTYLTDLSSRRVSSLSGGERTRAYIALLLAQDAPLLMMDEPTAFLDASAKKAFYSALQALARKEGKGILTVMHDVGDALALADRVLVLNEGTLVFDGTPARCIEEDIPSRIFGLQKHTSLESGRLFFE